MRFRKKILAGLGVLGAASLTALSAALPASAITGPFSWASTSTASWCPTWHGQNGCNNTQTATSYTSDFVPANVSLASGTVSLAMTGGQAHGAAFNTENTPTANETYNFPFTIFEKWNMPCSTVSGVVKVDNTPSMWMARTTGGTPGGTGEIDIAEGSHGNLAWTYWYTTDGVNLSKVTGTLVVSGDTSFPCGSLHTGGDYYYKVHAFTNTNGKPQINIYAKSVLQGGVSQSCVGTPCTNISVPVDTSTRYLINGYGASSFGGPGADVTALVKEFSYTAS